MAANFPILFVLGCKDPARTGGGAGTTKPTTGANEMASTPAPAPAPAPAVGDLAPAIEGPDLDGVDFKLADYRGKVVVLDFWGDW